MKNNEILLGQYASHWFHKSPKRMLFAMSYYKFAAKLIGKNKKVLDVGCNEGLGTLLLSQKCGYAKGLDFDEQAIKVASTNFTFPNLEFEFGDLLTIEKDPSFDALVSFDVIEHILPQNANHFLTNAFAFLNKNGMAIIGTPSLISQNFASEWTKKGHVNVYSHERLVQEMKDHFSFVFIFAANDEIVHTGYLPLAHYFIIVGCKKR